MNRKNSIWLLSLLSLPALVWLAYAAQKTPVSTRQERPVLVRTAPVVRKKMAFPVHTSGRIARKAEMQLSFKVGGIVRKIFVDEGAQIRRGQRLAELDLQEIDARVRQARSAFAKAGRDHARVQQLYADSVATLEQLQDTETALAVARSALQIAEFNATHARITAPAAGRILRRFVEANELVAPGVPVFRFASSEQGWVLRASVSERDILTLQLGDSAAVVFDALPGQPFTGAVSELPEAINPLTGTFEVEIAVLAPETKLISGFFARADLYPSQKETYSVIPAEALYAGDAQLGWVFTLDAARGVAEKKTVKIARIMNDGIAVAAGLEHVSRVITAGTAYLSAGRAVRVQGE